MGFTRTLVILLIGVVIPLVVIVTVLIGHSRSTPLSPLQVTRDAVDNARL
jgi:preprotein translocase subunit SecG